MRTLLASLLVVAACSRDHATPPAETATPTETAPKAAEAPPPAPAPAPVEDEPLHDGQWVELTHNGKRNLAYVYTDQQAGQSAKGGPVSDKPTKDEINALVERPPSTWREPASFGAHPLDAATVKKLGLSPEPSWLKYYK